MRNIFSIGYGNRTLSHFINLLSEYDVQLLVDVRSYPYSRFQNQYNRKSLEQNLNSVGIDYLFLGDSLGGKPKDKSLYTNEKLDYKLMNKSLLYKASIKKIQQLAEDQNVCLMCCELNPNSCHRKNLIGDTFSRQHISLKHINERDLISNHTTPPFELF